MPEIIESWLESPNLHHLGRIYEKILSSWQDLLEQESPARKRSHVASGLLGDAFPYAGSRITFNRFGNRPLGSREAAAAFSLLEKLNVVRLVHPVTGTAGGSVPDTGRSPRLQFADTGMVNYFSGIRQQVADAEDLTLLFGGQILRHVAGQELTASGSGNGDGYVFWTRGKTQSSAETDFVIPWHDLLIPVAARSGEPGRLRSLHQFIDAAPHPYAVQLHADRLTIRKTNTISGKPFYLLSLPYYLAGRIGEHLEGFVRFVGA
jgi:hypothetical protein